VSGEASIVAVVIARPVVTRRDYGLADLRAVPGAAGDIADPPAGPAPDRMARSAVPGLWPPREFLRLVWELCRWGCGKCGCAKPFRILPTRAASSRTFMPAAKRRAISSSLISARTPTSSNARVIALPLSAPRQPVETTLRAGGLGSRRSTKKPRRKGGAKVRKIKDQSGLA
jgi:hypothetical protein